MGNSEDMIIRLEKRHFPYWVQMGTIQLTEMKLYGNSSQPKATMPLDKELTNTGPTLTIPAGELSGLSEAWIIIGYSLG